MIEPDTRIRTSAESGNTQGVAVKGIAPPDVPLFSGIVRPKVQFPGTGSVPDINATPEAMISPSRTLGGVSSGELIDADRSHATGRKTTSKSRAADSDFLSNGFNSRQKIKGITRFAIIVRRVALVNTQIARMLRQRDRNFNRTG